MLGLGLEEVCVFDITVRVRVRIRIRVMVSDRVVPYRGFLVLVGLDDPRGNLQQGLGLGHCGQG